MAHSDKNIVITPNINSTTANPQIVFSGADASLGPQNITLRVYPTSNGTLSFEGSAGQLFSITNSLTGTIFGVNDVSGIPSIEVLDTGLVKLAQYSGRVLIGTGTDNGADKLQVNGDILATNFKGNATTAATWQTARTITIGSTGKAVNGSAAVSWSLAEIGAPSTTGGGASGTWGINVTGNAATASTLQTTRNINGTGFNGSANIDTTEWYHSDRDFPNGTLITTSINYAVSSGDPFVLEIRGNSYGSIIPLDIQYQGYIYTDTIINHGGISNGTNISGLVAINNGGFLCFWFPSQGYWNGYNVKVYSAYATRAVNRVTSITGVAKPTTAKEVALSDNIRQSLHSGNFTSYAPSLTGGGASGTWAISISGNAATATSATSASSATTADQIDSVGFINTNQSGVNADTSASNGIAYTTSNNAGSLIGSAQGWPATDGALYSQHYSSSWEHQIYGDYRTGQIAVRGKNSGTWQTWRNVPTIIIQDTAPTTSVAGNLWWESDTGKLKIYYNDGSSSQWVDAVPIPDLTVYYSKAGGAISGPVVCQSSLTTNILTTGGTNVAGSVTGQWVLTTGSTWQATFADLAEWYTSDHDYEYGTVVVFGGEYETTISTQANDSRVAGVISKDPAFIMNIDLPGPSSCVALQGRLPVKVIGRVSKGDLLVTSNIPGVATANNNAAPYTVIGKAIENKDSEEQGMVLVSVGR
jgi:hypothetical protein